MSTHTERSYARAELLRKLNELLEAPPWDRHDPKRSDDLAADLLEDWALVANAVREYLRADEVEASVIEASGRSKERADVVRFVRRLSEHLLLSVLEHFAGRVLRE